MEKLLKKFITFSYGGIFGAIIGLITTIITTRILSPEEFGKASMFTLLLSLSTIFVIFGTDQAFGRFFYEEMEKKRGALLYNCLKVVLIFLIPFMLILVLFNKQISLLLFGEYNFIVMLILVVGIITHAFDRFAMLVIRMQQKGNIYSLIQIINRLLILIFILVFYYLFGATYEILAFATVLSCAILLIFLIIGQKNFWGINNIKVKGVRHSKSDIFKFSYPLVLTMMITWLFEGIDKIALRQWADFQELGLYSAAFKIIALLTIIKGVFTTFWVPVAYETFEKDPENREFYANVSKIVSYGMLVIAIFVVMFKDIIIMLLGNEYKGASSILAFLVFIPVMYTISETTVMGINFYKKVKWHIVIVIITCIFNIIGNLLLVPQYGGVGAAISTGIAYIIFFSLRTYISLKYYKVKYGLNKVYLSTMILLTYASFLLFDVTHTVQFLIGCLALLLVSFIYREDIQNIYGLTKK